MAQDDKTESLEVLVLFVAEHRDFSGSQYGSLGKIPNSLRLYNRIAAVGGDEQAADLREGCAVFDIGVGVAAGLVGHRAGT